MAVLVLGQDGLDPGWSRVRSRGIQSGILGGSLGGSRMGSGGVQCRIGGNQVWNLDRSRVRIQNGSRAGLCVGMDSHSMGDFSDAYRSDLSFPW
jgi:hypothetical protein